MKTTAGILCVGSNVYKGSIDIATRQAGRDGECGMSAALHTNPGISARTTVTRSQLGDSSRPRRVPRAANRPITRCMCTEFNAPS